MIHSKVLVSSNDQKIEDLNIVDLKQEIEKRRQEGIY